ncbi:MAG TPA: class II fumarate hydratase, partial [Deltaproteobacteria bacterium]|nr:class II fumarate hydratase [Deltaproteobacteria bacterium]
MSDSYRLEKDSMGEVQVPQDALYGAQTQRAVNNFPISGAPISRSLIRALGQVKFAAAKVNVGMGHIPEDVASAIQATAQEIIAGKLDRHFPIDIYQTGSGTSSNMNTNEVVAHRAMERQPELSVQVHPNDHVNFGQSSNDTFPTALRIAAYTEVREQLLPALQTLKDAFLAKGKEYAHVVKTGRTHLMDAMPVTLEQEFGGYARQLTLGRERIESALERLAELPMGGTAVGTGINTHPEFPKKFATEVAKLTGCPFREAENHFEAQATVDAPVELSGQLKTVAVGLLKIANDLRWMNSGPNGGLG